MLRADTFRMASFGQAYRPPFARAKWSIWKARSNRPESLLLRRIFQRTAFSSMFSFQTTLDELPPSEVSGLDKAKADAIRLTDAIERLMKPDANSTAEAAA